MKVDLDVYKINRKPIQTWYLNNKDNVKSAAEAASLMATASHTPVIVCCFYIGEVDGWSESILKSIEDLTQFYGYKEILNKSEGYPRNE